MTLKLNNSQVRQFYDQNIAAHVICANDALLLKSSTKANQYLVEIDNALKNLKACFPTATQDIRAIENLQSELLAKVTLLEESPPQQTHTRPFEVDPSFIRPEVMTDFAPTGINRPLGVMNCGFNSIFQCVMNTKSLPIKILGRRNGIFKALAPLIRMYHQAQTSAKSIANDLDMKIFRQWAAPAVSTNNASQEDAYDIWETLSEKLQIRPVIEQSVNGNAFRKIDPKESEPTIRLKLTETPKSFSSLIKEYFRTESDEGQRIEKRFQETPSVLAIQADRTAWDPSIGKHNLNTPLNDVPEFFRTESSWMESDRGPANYDLKGCVIQEGTLDSGHFISMQKKPDGWYQVNDAVVKKIEENQAKDLLKNGYLFFYEKTDRSAPPLDLLPAIRTASTRPTPSVPPLDHLPAIRTASTKPTRSSRDCLKLPAWSLNIAALVSLAGIALACAL